MIDLPYSLIIEATEEPAFFGFYSTDLEGFSGIGYSVEDCLVKARWGMKEHNDNVMGKLGDVVDKVYKPGYKWVMRRKNRYERILGSGEFVSEVIKDAEAERSDCLETDQRIWRVFS